MSNVNGVPKRIEEVQALEETNQRLAAELARYREARARVLRGLVLRWWRSAKRVGLVAICCCLGVAVFATIGLIEAKNIADGPRILVIESSLKGGNGGDGLNGGVGGNGGTLTIVAGAPQLPGVYNFYRLPFKTISLTNKGEIFVDAKRLVEASEAGAQRYRRFAEVMHQTTTIKHGYWNQWVLGCGVSLVIFEEHDYDDNGKKYVDDGYISFQGRRGELLRLSAGSPLVRYGQGARNDAEIAAAAGDWLNEVAKCDGR